MEAKVLLATSSLSDLAESIASSGLVPQEELTAALAAAGDDAQALARGRRLGAAGLSKLVRWGQSLTSRRLE